MDPAPDRLRVIVFPGVQDLPNFAAEACGFFTRRNLAVETIFTSGSKQLRAGLADGSYDIAHGAVDNAIDMIRTGGLDIVTVCGLDHGFNTFFVQPDIENWDDLRGRTIVVDAPDTAFALMIIEILARHGLKPGDYEVKSLGSTRFRLEAMRRDSAAAGAMLNLPFAILAQRAGLKVMADPARELGPYQSCCGFARRDWAADNADTLTRYLAAYLEGLRWAMDPANRQAAIRLLVERLGVARDVAAICLDIVTDPKTGFNPVADIDRDGFANMLALRQKAIGGEGDLSPDPYIDLSYHAAARASLVSSSPRASD